MTVPATGIRLGGSLAMAFLATSLLFFLMQSLIAFEKVVLNTAPVMNIKWVTVPELDDDLPPTQRVQPPEAPELPPEAPDVVIGPTQPVTIYRTGEPIENPHDGPALFGLADGAQLPIVRVQPSYPRSAITRGLEGYTLVEFDVWTDGSVRNPRIIESFPRAVFDASSLKAIARFRYKPRVENGEALVTTGVKYRFTFELAQDAER